MIVNSNDHVVFNTSESGGDDICVMDSIGRFTLIHESEIETVVGMLLEMKSTSTFSIDEIDPADYVDDD